MRLLRFLHESGSRTYVLCSASGGQHYDIAGDDAELAFCPLASLDSESDRTWAKEYIEILITLQLGNGEFLSPKQRALIHHSVEALASAPEASQRTFTNLLAHLQDENCREALAYYALGGNLGFLLDAKKDGLKDSNFQVFEMEHLMGMGEKAVTPVLLYLFHQIEKRLNGAPTFIVLDEAWSMFRHPIFADKIRSWIKESRKKNACIIFSTQHLSDLKNSPLSDVLLQECATIIALANPEAKDKKEVADVYRSIGLNDRQINIIANALKKRHYYMINADGKRLFDLGLGELSLAFTASSSKEDLKKAKALVRESTGDWIPEWLKYKNVSEFWLKRWKEMQDISSMSRVAQ